MKQAYNRGKELTHMSKVKSVEIRCEHCKQWFTPILTFGTSEAFDTSGLEGNLHQCRNSNCRKSTGCNKENMRVLFEDGDSWAIRPAVKSAVKSGGKSLNTFGRGGWAPRKLRSL